ncbi:hypothetical protein, conserved, (fragment), partial [Trypanosoma brucei gambiense DAL972]
KRGELYYFNFKTGESIGDHPLDEHFRELLRSEKINPSPKSIANGAKKPGPALVSPAKNLSERSSNQEERTSSLGSKTKLQALKTLKQKRELPEELRIDFKGGSNLSSGSTERSRTAQRLKGVLSAAGSSGPKIPPLSQTQENVIPPTISGEKALISKPFAVKKAPQSEDSDPLSCGPTGVSEAKTGAPANQTEGDIGQEYQNRIKFLKEDLENKFNKEKEMLEKQYASETEQVINEFIARSETEKKKHQLLEEKHNREYSEAKLRWKAEIEALNEQKTKEIEEIKKMDTRLLDAMKQCTEEADKCVSDFISTYEDARNALTRALQGTRETHLTLVEPSLSMLIDRAQQSYDKAIKDLGACYASESENIKLKFAANIVVAERDAKAAVEEIMRQKENRISMISENTRPTAVIGKNRTETRGTQCEWDDLEDIQNKHTYAEGTSTVSCNHNADTIQSVKEILGDAVATLRGTRDEELNELKVLLREFAEEELRTIFDKISQGRQPVSCATIVDTRDDMNVVQHVRPEPVKDEGNAQKDSHAPPVEILRKEDLATAVSEAFERIFVNTPSFPFSANKESTHVEEPDTPDECRTPSVLGMNAVGLDQQVRGFPISIQDQRSLLESEIKRVADMRRIIESQRTKLEKRRTHLHTTRHRWKQDVVIAKKEGVKASSHQGQLLNKVRHVLDGHIKKFEYDEAVLRGSEEWLLMKERSIHKMEHRIRDAERRMVSSGGAGSPDTCVTTGHCLKCLGVGDDCSLVSHNVRPRDTLIIAYTQTLNRIVRRLERVAAVMHHPGRRRRFPTSYVGKSAH